MEKKFQHVAGLRLRYKSGVFFDLNFVPCHNIYADTIRIPNTFYLCIGALMYASYCQERENGFMAAVQVRYQIINHYFNISSGLFFGGFLL